MDVDVDARFFGLQPTEDPSHQRFTIASHLARPDTRLYGGAAIGVTLAVVEAVARRPAVWATTQFVSGSSFGTEVDVNVEELARGRRSSQVRVTAADAADGTTIFTGLGAAAEPKEGGLIGTIDAMPSVRPPSDGREVFAWGRTAEIGWHLAAEMRLADSRDGRLAIWTRLLDGEAWTPGRLAFVADMVPVAICRALGRTGAGTSLDNTLRAAAMVDTEWVLIDLRPHLAHAGFGHGTAHLWSEDGTLMASASQTAAMLVFDVDPLTGPPPDRPPSEARLGRSEQEDGPA